MPRETFETLLAADWSAKVDTRSVCKASVSNRTVDWATDSDLTLESLLSLARHELQQHGPVLVSIDVVLGVPTRFFEEAVAKTPSSNVDDFVRWLCSKNADEKFWQTVPDANSWSVHSPFFQVPSGQGTKTKFEDAATRENLYRKVDELTNSKSVFIVSGIPGTVGSGSRSFWRELAAVLASENERDFRVWPFEGKLKAIGRQCGIALAENYPAISYTSVFAKELPHRYLILSKTKRQVRETAVDLLGKQEWVTDLEITLPSDLDRAVASEDDFDSLMAALGQLRCVLNGYVLENPELDDEKCEGGMLLTNSVDFESSGSKFPAEIPSNCRPNRTQRSTKKSSKEKNKRKSTEPGYVNKRNQKVIRRVGPSPSHKNQYTYELECQRCKLRYGANGFDIEGAGAGAGRGCPKCDGASPGDPI